MLRKLSLCTCCRHHPAQRPGVLFALLQSGADVLGPNQIKAYLSHGFGRYCNVRIYRTIGKSGLTFVGFKSDTDGARWLLDRLADFVHNALFEHLLDHDLLAPKERKQETLGFVYGRTGRITATLIAACEQSQTERTTSGKELVIIKDHAIKDFMKGEGIELKCARPLVTAGGRRATVQAMVRPFAGQYPVPVRSRDFSKS